MVDNVRVWSFEERIRVDRDGIGFKVRGLDGII